MPEQLGWGRDERRSCGEGRNWGRAGDVSTWSPDVSGFQQSQQLAGSRAGSGCPGGARGFGSCAGLLNVPPVLGDSTA